MLLDPSKDGSGTKASAKPGAGNRRARTGTTASRTDSSRRARDARRIDKPKAASKPVSKPKKVSKKSSKKTSTKLTKKPKKLPKVTKASPPPPTKVDPTPLIKTKQTGVPVLATSFNSNTIEQERDILNAFLAFSGTELFQYTNEQSIDGMFSDVSVISVLSSRRKDYTPNDIIQIYPPFLRNVYRGTGPDINKLYFDIDGTKAGGTMTVSFFVGTGSSVSTIGSIDYV